jgi:hypothetical protein
MENIVLDTNCLMQDHHFDVLRTIDFPRVDVIGIEKFLELLTEESL